MSISGVGIGCKSREQRSLDIFNISTTNIANSAGTVKLHSNMSDGAPLNCIGQNLIRGSCDECALDLLNVRHVVRDGTSPLIHVRYTQAALV